MTTVYIVKGNHDGNIGVFTNEKKAIKACVRYVENGGARTEKANMEYFDAEKKRFYMAVANGCEASFDIMQLNYMEGI